MKMLMVLRVTKWEKGYVNQDVMHTREIQPSLYGRAILWTFGTARVV